MADNKELIRNFVRDRLQDNLNWSIPGYVTDKEKLEDTKNYNESYGEIKNLTQDYDFFNRLSKEEMDYLVTLMEVMMKTGTTVNNPNVLSRNDIEDKFRYGNISTPMDPSEYFPSRDMYGSLPGWQIESMMSKNYRNR